MRLVVLLKRNCVLCEVRIEAEEPTDHLNISPVTRQVQAGGCLAFYEIRGGNKTPCLV
jgi:hypothetical protein